MVRQGGLEQVATSSTRLRIDAAATARSAPRHDCAMDLDAKQAARPERPRRQLAGVEDGVAIS